MSQFEVWAQKGIVGDCAANVRTKSALCQFNHKGQARPLVPLAANLALAEGVSSRGVASFSTLAVRMNTPRWGHDETLRQNRVPPRLCADRRGLRWLLGALLLYFSSVVQAATSMEVDTPLGFGVLALRANSSVSALQVSDQGRVTATGQIIVIGGATAAELRFTGFPAGVLLQFSFDDTTLSEGGFNLPEFLTATAFEHPESRLTDSNGSATITLGAQLRTSGSGTAYPDAPYAGTIPVRVRYWQPEAEDYVVHFDTLAVTAQLQSTLTLAELQPLSFGTVAAFADPAGIASLRIAPNGTLFTTQQNQARLLPLGGSAPGRFQVSAAAPSVRVAITAQADPIQLTHDSLGASAMRFTVEDFVTSPAESGITDEKGELAFALGATLKTTLGSEAYAPGNYSGSYTLTVSY